MPLLPVLVPTPAHARLPSLLQWESEHILAPGSLVRVPLGQREVLGIVWDTTADMASLPEVNFKPICAHLQAIAPLTAAWRNLIGFCADYYQRSLGEVALAALPPHLRSLSPVQLTRFLQKIDKQAQQPHPETNAPVLPTLSSDQATVLSECIALSHTPKPKPALLFGATGSGKTEVYLRLVQAVLESDRQAQVLVMVPEINLTPQLQARFAQRFAAFFAHNNIPQPGMVSMHSHRTPAQRLHAWLAAHSGKARIVLGTRMSVFASLPNLALIVVDEEHDPSYKSQDGARHSARDLAVYRSQAEGIPLLLGSATPQLETWHKAQSGAYHLLHMPRRIAQGTLPTVHMLDMQQQPQGCVIADAVLCALRDRIARGEQSLVFLNRRGYAQVLHCPQCGWKSACPHCSAFSVFHKIDKTLRCHHCAFVRPVPRACPDCGNLDIAPLGRGTEKIEEALHTLLGQHTRPDGTPVRIARLDADSIKHKGALQAQLTQVHAGEVDVLVGTQMITKGHDFRRITLVLALSPDSALFASDFRAPERIFALLVQAAGRAGRDSVRSTHSELWVQSYYPQHPVFQALRTYDYEHFAKQQLAERQNAHMPPFAHQALLRAEAKTQDAALTFLHQAVLLARKHLEQHPAFAHIHLYPPVPMHLQRVAKIERSQILVESHSRKALQQFLHAWRTLLPQARTKGLIRFAIDVDPLSI